MAIRFDFSKIEPQYVNTDPEKSELIGRLQIPILEGLDRVISDGENEVLITEHESLPLGHTIKIKLYPTYALPAPIFVDVDGFRVGQYTYRDEAFVQRTKDEFMNSPEYQRRVLLLQ